MISTSTNNTLILQFRVPGPTSSSKTTFPSNIYTLSTFIKFIPSFTGRALKPSIALHVLTKHIWIVSIQALQSITLQSEPFLALYASYSIGVKITIGNCSGNTHTISVRVILIRELPAITLNTVLTIPCHTLWIIQIRASVVSFVVWFNFVTLVTFWTVILILKLHTVVYVGVKAVVF